MANIAGGDFGAGLANTAQGAGQNAVNSFNPTDVAGSQRNNFNQLYNSQLGDTGPKSATDYMGAYSQAVANNPTYTSLYNTANQQFNVPATAQQATYLQNQVNQVAPNAYQTAKGFDYSEPQVENAINTNLRFLQPEANAAAQVAQTNQNLAGQYVNLGMQQNQQNLLPIQSYGPMLQQAMAQQATGWNQAAQNEFQGLQAKMNAGVQLSQQEMDRANSLLQAQQAYQQAINTAQIQQQFQNVGAGNNLVNTFTNSIINPGELAQQTGIATY